jgi:cytochrome c oxidase subunit II
MMDTKQNRRWLKTVMNAPGLSWIASLVLAKPKQQVIKLAVKKFDFSPSEIQLIKGVPVVLELTSLDVLMGFFAPDLELRSLIVPNKILRLNFVPDKVGSFPFLFDVFCGNGHVDMGGMITVID